MSGLAGRLRAIGARVAAGEAPDGVQVVAREDGTPNSAELEVPAGLTLAALQEELGSGGAAVPKARPGPARTRFDGEGYSVLASHDADGAVVGLVVVRET